MGNIGSRLRHSRKINALKQMPEATNETITAGCAGQTAPRRCRGKNGDADHENATSSVAIA